MTNATLKEKPDAGNPHVAPTLRYGGTGRLDEGEVAPANPRRGSLLYKLVIITLCMLSLAAFALDTTISNEFWCTWKYVNAVPAVRTSNPNADYDSTVFTSAAVKPTAGFQSIVFDLSSAHPNRRFLSFPPIGFLLFLR